MVIRRLERRRRILRRVVGASRPEAFKPSASRSTADGPADLVPVPIDFELGVAIEAHAEAEHTPTSEIIRRALSSFLEVA